jgi:lysophospholipase L1-like esterase
MRKAACTVIVLLLLLLLSVAANVILLNENTRNYRDLNETRLDPLGLQAYPAGTGVPPRTGGRTRVVFFGDSRAYEWPAPQGLADVEFINRGISAQTTAQALGRFEAHVAPLRPDVVVVQIGINDLKTIPLYPEREEAIIEACQDDIRQIVTKSLDSGAVVILTTIFPVGDVPLERRLYWSDRVPPAIGAVNAYIRSLAQDRVMVFDASAVLADANGEARPAYQRDFLHLNARGYTALNQSLTPLLERVARRSRWPRS